MAATAAATDVLLLSRDADDSHDGSVPNSAIVSALQEQGYSVDTSLLGRDVRPLRFDAELIAALNRADVVLVTYPPPVSEYSSYICGYLPVQVSLSSVLNGAERPVARLLESTTASDLAMLVEQAIASAPLPEIAFAVPPDGDLNENGVYDALDIELLATALRAGNGDPRWDLNHDGQLSTDDLRTLITERFQTYFGDATLNGHFGTDDLIAVFQAGKYETQTVADWTEGDWTGNGQFDSSDFVIAFQDTQGYCPGPRTAVTAVPEPTCLYLVTSAASCLLLCRKA